MKKILRVAALAVFGIISIVDLESRAYAMLGGNGSEANISDDRGKLSAAADSQIRADSDESVNYVLNIRYVKWDQEDGEPFPEYTQGENYFAANTRLRLPVMGEVIGNKRVKMISCSIDDEGAGDRLSTRIMKRENSFEMPASDLSLSILFRKNTDKE